MYCGEREGRWNAPAPDSSGRTRWTPARWPSRRLRGSQLRRASVARPWRPCRSICSPWSRKRKEPALTVRVLASAVELLYIKALRTIMRTEYNIQGSGRDPALIRHGNYRIVYPFIIKIRTLWFQNWKSLIFDQRPAISSEFWWFLPIFSTVGQVLLLQKFTQLYF